MGQKAIIRFWWDLGYGLRPKSISPFFANPPSTTHV